MQPNPLFQGLLSPRDDASPRRPATRLDVQRHHLDELRLAHKAAPATGDPGAIDRRATLTDAMRDAIGNVLIDLGERIRHYQPGPPARGTRAH